MDLGAYAKIDLYKNYVNRNYGNPPRLRGIRLMKIEKPEEHSGSRQMNLYNSYCGQDVVYIHTRCGGDEYDEDSNYCSFGADVWEGSNYDTFLESINDEMDFTYRDHYFKAVVDDEYLNLIKECEENV